MDRRSLHMGYLIPYGEFDGDGMADEGENDAGADDSSGGVESGGDEGE